MTEWITCKDYLHECWRNVLVTLDNGDPFIGYVIPKNGGYEWRTISDHIPIKVKAWMYIEPYKGE